VITWRPARVSERPEILGALWLRRDECGFRAMVESPNWAPPADEAGQWVLLYERVPSATDER
jgi:hypothetical protein